MPRARFMMIAGAVAIATATTVFGIAAASASKPDVSSISADSNLDVLASTQSSADRMPSQVNLGRQGEGGLLESSVRALGSDARGSYYLSTDASGNVCLTVSVKGTTNSATACGTPQQVAEGGLSLAAYGPGTSPVWTEAYLIPDGVSVAGAPAALSRLTPNLLVGDTRAVSDAARELSVAPTAGRSAAPSFKMELIPAPSFK
ncbi:hypothetical protein [Leifsonia aquatica]|uniref:hypothetical protein n=1 Tax=Leifsonia aquatica TaxID=144185 RepID=UPI0038292A67